MANEKATGLFEGDNLLNSIVNISKAGAYDIQVEQIKELQAKNDELIKKIAAMYATTKVLVYVYGGTVQYINSSNPNTRIVVIDQDNNLDDKNGFISEYEPDAIYENHYEAFTDTTNPVDMEIRDELKRMKF